MQLTSPWRCKCRSGAGKHALQKRRTDQIGSSSRTIQPHVVDHNDTDIGFCFQLLLELPLHRPVDCLVQDVGLGNIASQGFSQSASTRMTFVDVIRIKDFLPGQSVRRGTVSPVTTKMMIPLAVQNAGSSDSKLVCCPVSTRLR